MLERRARVLIADADPGVRRELAQRLADADVTVDAVEDGRAALEKLGGTFYPVVILDVALPLVTSEHVLEFISKLPATARPVVLVLAAPGAARSLDVDVAQIVLRKPCDLAQLADIVRSCVRSTTDTVPKGEGLPAADDHLRIRPAA